MATTTSTSASHPKLSAAGSAHVTGLTILANPRRIHASKTIVFDAQLYLGPTCQDLLIGSLRYFNSADLSFEDRPSFYTINATFAQRGPMAEVPVSGNRALSDYVFIGDIQSVTPLGPPGPRYPALEGSPHDSPSEGNEGDELQVFTIDPCTRPYLYITGIAMECSREEATFEINVQQYVSCVKPDPSKPGANRLKPTTCFLCHIPDSAKYRSWGKPMPGNKRYVSVCGFLTGVDRSGEVEQFLIDVENVTFCGQYVQPANSVALASPSSPGKSPALFSYGPPQSPPHSRKRLNQDGAGASG